MEKRSKKIDKRCSAPPEPEQTTSLIRAIGTRLVADWVKELVDYWLGDHDLFR